MLRERWYDPLTGTWLTPDPMGYRDSSNLYSFAGGDPINRRDPTGEITLRAALSDGELSGDEIADLELTDEEVKTIIDSIQNSPEPTTWWGRLWRTKIVPIDFNKDPEGARKQAQYILLLRNQYFQQYMSELYDLARELNPYHYIPEAVGAIATGKEPVKGSRIDRKKKAFDLLLYIGFLKGMKYLHAHLQEIRARALGSDGWEPVPKLPGREYFTEEEWRIVEYLKARGHTVEPNLAQGMPGAGRQGDAFVDGVHSEFKTLSKSGAADSNTIKQMVNDSLRGTGQARRIYIDARGTGLTEAEATRGVARAMGIARGKLDAVIVIGDNFQVGG